MNSEKTNTLLIKTPEGIAFSLLLAGPVTRCLAWLVDLGCIVGASILIGFLLSFLRWISLDLGRAISVLAYFLLQVGYGIAMEWLWRGQTVGKRLLRLRVMDAQGLRLQFSQVVIRNLLRFVDMLPAFYLVGGLACLISRRAQRLGDFAANTIVVYQPRQAEARPRSTAGRQIQLAAGISASGSAPAAARFARRKAGLAVQALLRRDDFEPAARLELFAEIAGHLRSLVEFPPEAIEGITDEQYVRNVVDVVFRARRPGKKEEMAPPNSAA